MLTLHKLKLFRIVYEHGSFNRAAQSLYLAQSVVSQHIHDLEAALGARLFERTSRGIRPTAAGEVLYGYVGKVQALLGEAELAIGQLDTQAAPQLDVAATPGVSVYLLPSWLIPLRQARPNLTVNMQTMLTHEVVRDVLNGRVHLGFLEGDTDGLAQEALGRVRVREVCYRVVVPPTHPWAGRTSISPSELKGQAFIHRQPTSRARRWLEGALGQHGVTLRATAELDSPGAVKYAVLNGMGVSVLPDYAIEREAERGELRCLAIDGVSMTRPLLMVWDKRQPFTLVQRAFIGVLAEQVPELALLL
ncbi:MAG: LysR family transcriptional regulator [Anaerolineae bacterium]|jgi:DNA-binding transcriptional LysR family regulator|nr:LysR family transcriptional regulator [Anaerolineae bacterium]